MPKRHYSTLKDNHSLQTVNVKKENDSNTDMSLKINPYIDDTCAHFYADIVEGKVTKMLEIHSDQLYTYGPKDVKIPTLGGNRSVRLPDGMNTRLVFGQDEAIYRSSQFIESCWTLDRESTLRTNGLGIGLMVSAFFSRHYLD